MKFTLSWLKDHLELDDSITVDILSEKLTMIGLEIEDIQNSGNELAPFTVAEITSVEKHPNADKLNLLSVNTGTDTLQIVCGAPNCYAGMKGVLATGGMVIPVYGERLKTSKIRGIESQGMMCSERELKLGDDHDGIIDLPKDAKVGAPATDYLNVDPAFEIAITPNRAECLGVRGIARDLAAAGVGKFKDVQIEPTKGTFKSPINVTIEDTKACPMYVARYIKGVKNCKSPEWLKSRLSAIGLRPINALVDITNYINYDRARPLHVFDAEKLNGDITVRMAKEDEKCLALDEKEYTLESNMIGICDDAGIQAIGGIMGGLNTGSQDDTVNVAVESAMFDAISIARTGRKLQIESDSRYRFEREVDPATTIIGAEMATKMILEICGGEPAELVVAGNELDTTREITMRPERVKQMCGVDLSKEEITKTLTALGFSVKDAGATLTVTPPSWRADVSGEHDLVEEAIRIYGYDNIPAVSVEKDAIIKPALPGNQRKNVAVRRALAARSMYETITWAFTSSKDAELFRDKNAKPVMIANPISSDLDEMRPSLLINLIQAAGRNIARDYTDLALFEVGAEFFGKTPKQQQTVAAGIKTGKTAIRHWAEAPRKVDVFDAKADAIAALAAADAPVVNLQVTADAPHYYHPGKSGVLRLGKNVLAYFGEIHPRVLKAMGVKETVVAFETYIEAIPAKKAKNKTKTRKLLRPSQFHAVERDFAFIVNSDVKADDVLKSAMGADKALITNAILFDVYEGDNVEDGKKSLAIQVTIQPTEKTLSDKEIELLCNKVVQSVNKRTGGELRK
ncbi:MAG: phenylalanine--tRNA ligase subunit beta [Alphaproteobacteria bacterium]|nr:phenylalanine--tRNA ligase subunit beta [Alphaproteobacteria bacterium]